MSLNLRTNRTTVHISGLDIATGAGSDFNYAQSHCPTLTRHSHKMTHGKDIATAAEALAAARANGRQVCKNCEKAALAQIEREAAAPAAEVEVAEVEAPAAPYAAGDMVKLRTGEVAKVSTVELVDGEWLVRTVRTVDGLPRFRKVAATTLTRA